MRAASSERGACAGVQPWGSLRALRSRGFWMVCLYACLIGIGAWAAARGEGEVVLARYVTSLKGRTRNQAHNAALAARSIHGTWIRPGAVFSFNRATGSWASDSGYRRAPVSYDGELLPSYGGGVCQASSGLYNAALLAGLTIVERHRHHWLPGYVPPGRDAAVAYSSIDLRLRNDLSWPVRLEAERRGDLLEFRVIGPRRLEESYAIAQRVESVTLPEEVRQPWEPGLPARTLRNPGKWGCRVKTFRITRRAGREVARELLSDDAYPAMRRLAWE